VTFFVWALVVVLMLLALAGAFVPAIADAPLIFLAAVVHKVFLPAYLSIWTLVAFAVCACAALTFDAACSIYGARRFGATAWGIFGGGAGALIGLFFGPFGVPLGAMIGAALSEWVFRRRSIGESLRAGFGAGLGFLASSVGRFLLCLAMIVWFFLDCFVF